jgi:hypothetical protein
MQTWPEGQAFAQAPQLFGSRVVSTHSPEQVISGDGHETWQTPLTESLPAPQAWPQAPQLFGSLRLSTQTPPQNTSRVGQLQRPETQTCFGIPLDVGAARTRAHLLAHAGGRSRRPRRRSAWHEPAAEQPADNKSPRAWRGHAPRQIVEPRRRGSHGNPPNVRAPPGRLSRRRRVLSTFRRSPAAQ